MSFAIIENINFGVWDFSVFIIEENLYSAKWTELLLLSYEELANGTGWWWEWINTSNKITNLKNRIKFDSTHNNGIKFNKYFIHIPNNCIPQHFFLYNKALQAYCCTSIFHICNGHWSVIRLLLSRNLIIRWKYWKFLYVAGFRTIVSISVITILYSPYTLLFHGITWVLM